MIPKRPYLPQLRRVKPEERPPLKLQDRDFDILRAVYENRFLTLPLLADLFPSDPSDRPTAALTAFARKVGRPAPGRSPATYPTNLSRRLAKLFHHRAVDRIRTVIGGPFIYGLTKDGARHLNRKFPDLRISETVDWSEKNHEAGTYYFDHTLMTARFRVALTAALRETKTAHLDYFEREHVGLRAHFTSDRKKFSVNPDAYFTLWDAPKNQLTAFFLEADLSTMTLDRLAEKYVAYAQFSLEGLQAKHFGLEQDDGRPLPFRVLTVTKSEARARNLTDIVNGVMNKHRRTALPSPPPRLRKIFYFISETVYAEHLTHVLASTWTSGEADDFEKKTSIIANPLPTSH